MILEILKLPNKRLKTIAKPVKIFDDKLENLTNDMLETMYKANGIGLAATQVDKHLRVFVADTSKEGSNPCIFINPKIINQQGEREYEEGCLSVPEYRAKIIRADTITLQYNNLSGDEITNDFDGLLSTCIQHELDHLNGIVFIDYLSKLKQKRVLKKLQKMN